MRRRESSIRQGRSFRRGLQRQDFETEVNCPHSPRARDREITIRIRVDTGFIAMQVARYTGERRQGDYPAAGWCRSRLLFGAVVEVDVAVTVTLRSHIRSDVWGWSAIGLDSLRLVDQIVAVTDHRKVQNINRFSGWGL